MVETSSTCMLNLHPPPLPPPFPFEITFPPSVPSTLPYGTLNPPNKRWKVPIVEKDSSSAAAGEDKTETVHRHLIGLLHVEMPVCQAFQPRHYSLPGTHKHTFIQT